MIEENVVSAAGAPHRFTYKTIQEAIREAGFEPQLRNQQYEWREIPESDTGAGDRLLAVVDQIVQFFHGNLLT
jgi:signal recognition particle subunit SEC65